MPVLAHLVSAALAVAAGTSGPDAVALRWRAGVGRPDLGVRLVLALEGAEERRLSVPERRARGAHETPPPCVNGVCQVRVEIPGYATKFGRASRTELVATLLDRAGVEPFATIAWVFVATGFRVDWSPPVFDEGDPAAVHGGGWGSVFVRLRLRVDPMNLPVIPERGRTQLAGRGWATLAAPRM